MRVTIVACVLMALCACSGSRSGLGTDALDSAQISGIEEEPIVLSGGEWEGEPYAADSPARPRVGRIRDYALVADFTGDGTDEAAVLLWSSGGGSGNFLWLSLIESAPGQARSMATEWIGDRVQVVEFYREDRALVLDLVAPGPEDAACCPRQRELRHYRYIDGELTGSTEVRGTVSTEDLVGPVWRLVDLGHGGGVPEAEVTLVFTDPTNFSGLAGCNDYAGTIKESDANRVTLEAAATTLRRCPTDMTSTETQFMMRLAATSWFAFSNGRLSLFSILDDEPGALVFERTAP